MPRPAATPEQREEIRKKIRQAAADIHKESGISGISARAIAVRAGVSVGTLYSYYKNLTDLLRSLWLKPVTEATKRLQEIAESHSDPEERLRAILESYAAFAHQNREVYRGVFLFVRPEGVPPPEDQAPVTGREFLKILSDAIAAGQKAGVFKKGDAMDMAHLLWAGLHGALALPHNFEAMAFDKPKQISDQMIEMLMASVAK